jgi:hypothetical protein
MDRFEAIDRWLGQRNRKVWLLFDDLDVLFGPGEEYRQERETALNGLFAGWLEMRAFTRLRWKFFIRADLYDRLTFENKSHFRGREISLAWREEDLWRLVLRQAASSSDTFADFLQQHYRLAVEGLERTPPEVLEQSLWPLWGQRFRTWGRGYTKNWILNRVTDTQDNRFPRSLILLLRAALDRERELYQQGIPPAPDAILRPQALREVWEKTVSEERLDAVYSEYPELKSWLEACKTAHLRSPATLQELEEVLGLRGNDLTEALQQLEAAGILRYSERDQRYRFAELYRPALQVHLRRRERQD